MYAGHQDLQMAQKPPETKPGIATGNHLVMLIEG
jgi:hypothetical protein